MDDGRWTMADVRDPLGHRSLIIGHRSFPSEKLTKHRIRQEDALAGQPEPSAIVFQ